MGIKLDMVGIVVQDMKKALDEVTRLNRKLREAIQRLNQSQSDLQDKVLDLEKFEDAVVGRELEMIKVKRQLADTQKELERMRERNVEQRQGQRQPQ